MAGVRWPWPWHPFGWVGCEVVGIARDCHHVQCHIIRENIALRQSLTNPYNICIFKNIHNSGKSTGKAIKA